MDQLDMLRKQLESYENQKRNYVLKMQSLGSNFFEDEEEPDVSNYDDIIDCLTHLIEALEKICSQDNTLRHNGKKDVEQIKRTARGIKKERQEEMRKSQEVIDVMNEIINICSSTQNT